jgi:alkylmercury lyase
MPQPPLSVAELADKLVGAVPRFDLIGRRVAVALYRQLAKGEPVSQAHLATLLNLSSKAISDALSACPVFCDGDGAVIGFGGLTVAVMPPHRFRVDGRTLYTWCAWDSLFIPGILGKAADVASRDPVTGTPISLRVAPNGVSGVHPASTVVSFLVPEREFDRSAITNFCHFVHFFGTDETGRAWSADHQGTFLLSIEDAFALGRLTNTRNFGDALGTHRNHEA